MKPSPTTYSPRGVAAPYGVLSDSSRARDRRSDARRFRAALGAFATGVTVITTGDGEHGYGMTANSFSAASLDPPLVLVCVNRRGLASVAIARHRRFAVNILSAGQEAVARRFSSPDRPRGADAFRGLAHEVTRSGSPILHGVAGYVDCELHASHVAGDHVIVIGRIVELYARPEAEPLVLFRGLYRQIA